ncbi:hypothetical protein [Pseudomonas koreensis]|uniref:hypothetical protein n=1 Tax=Pseudomonas koreensis TaxID=198620 RepID=UPI002FCA8850
MEEYEESADKDSEQEANSSPLTQSSQDEVLEQRHEITAYRSYQGTDYWCVLDVSGEFTADGSRFRCRTYRYNAKANGARKGNLHVHASSQNSWLRDWDDVGIQDGNWHALEDSGWIDSPNGSANVYFRYIYDKAGADVQLDTQVNFHFKPATPFITSPSGNVTTSPFPVRGTGGVYGSAYLIVHNADGGAGLAAAVIESNGNWTANVSFPSGIKTLTLYAKQSIRNIVSDESNRVAVNLVVTAVSIDSPKDGDSIRERKPVIYGKGHTGATINIHRANNGTPIYGTGTVRNGEWSIPLTTPLPAGPFTMVAGQIYAGETIWSSNVSVSVLLYLPVITQPADQSVQSRSFLLSGTGGEAGATMKIHVDLTDVVVGTLASVTGDAWTVPVVIPASILPGEIRLAAEQTLGTLSGRSIYRSFKIRPDRVASLSATVDGNAKVTVKGSGTVGLTLDIHYVGNQTPVKSFTVDSNPWSKDFPDWLPSATRYSIGARQSTPGGDNQPIYSDWTEVAATFTVAVPVPTLNHRVSSEGIPTFSGVGRNWPGQAACQIEVRLNNTGVPIVPIVEVMGGETWSSAASERWAPGTYSVTARQLFGTLPSTWVPAIAVDIPAPLVVIEKVAENGSFPQFSGQCWPGALVTITFSDNDDSHPVPDIDTDGKWTFQRPAAFSPGKFTASATQTFGGQTSHPVSMSFDVPMSVPVITPPPGGQTEYLPVLHGTGGIDGCLIQVLDFVTHEVLGAVDATADSWTVELTELDYISHTVFARQSLGNIESVGKPVMFTVVLFAPTLNLALSRTSVPRTFMVEGYARRGKESDRTEVELYLGEALQPRIHPRFADGYYKHRVTLPLGPCELKARQFFKDQISPFTGDVEITVVPDKAHIETPGVDEAVGQLLNVCGFGYPGDTVVVALAGAIETLLGTAVVEENATWFCQVVLPETAGELSIVTEQRNGIYVSGWSTPRKLQLLDVEPRFTAPSEGAWTSRTPGFAGDARTHASVDVCAWYDSGTNWAENLDGSDGSWAGTPEHGLPEGPNWARAVQIIAGKRSMPADSKRFEVASPDEAPTQAPQPPLI